MSYFLKTQYRQQIAMLQKATLVYDPRIKPPQKTTNPHIRKLKNFKNMTVLVQADHRCLFQVGCEYSRCDKQLRKDQIKLQRIPFDAVTVVGYRTALDFPGILTRSQASKNMTKLRQTCAEMQRIVGMQWPAEWEGRLMKVKWLKDRMRPKKCKSDGKRDVWDVKLKKAERDLQCCLSGK